MGMLAWIHSNAPSGATALEALVRRRPINPGAGGALGGTPARGHAVALTSPDGPWKTILPVGIPALMGSLARTGTPASSRRGRPPPARAIRIETRLFSPDGCPPHPPSEFFERGAASRPSG